MMGLSDEKVGGGRDGLAPASLPSKVQTNVPDVDALTENEMWVLVRALDDYADDAAERAAEYRHQNDFADAEHYDLESSTAAYLLDRFKALAMDSPEAHQRQRNR